MWIFLNRQRRCCQRTVLLCITVTVTLLPPALTVLLTLFLRSPPDSLWHTGIVRIFRCCAVFALSDFCFVFLYFPGFFLVRSQISIQRDSVLEFAYSSPINWRIGRLVICKAWSSRFTCDSSYSSRWQRADDVDSLRKVLASNFLESSRSKVSCLWYALSFSIAKLTIFNLNEYRHPPLNVRKFKRRALIVINFLCLSRVTLEASRVCA